MTRQGETKTHLTLTLPHAWILRIHEKKTGPFWKALHVFMCECMYSLQ